MRLAYDIALRFLRAAKVQTFLIVLGIAIGVSVQIFIGSLIQGLQIDLIDTTIGSQSQITVKNTSGDEQIEDSSSLEKEISSQDGVYNVSSVAEGQALLQYGEDGYSMFVRGISFPENGGIYKIQDRLVEGELPDRKGEILIGVNLAKEANLKVEDQVTFLTDFNRGETATITGFFDLEQSNLNSTWILTDTETAQDLFGYGEDVTSIEMQVEDVFQADTIGDAIETDLPEGFTVENWKEQNAALLSGLDGQSISSYMIQAFVMISVLLGIASVLAISVIQKSRQIGILKAMGIRNGTASLIFLFQGLLLGIAGAVLGILLGLGLAFAFTSFALNPDGSPVVPLFINPQFIAFSAGFALLVAVTASLVPARKSSKLNPIEVIRNG